MARHGRHRRQQILNAQRRVRNVRSRTAARQGRRRRSSPRDSQAVREQGDVEFRRTSGLADVNADAQSRSEEFGLGPNAGSNPYSHAALLKKQRAAGQRGVLNRAGNQLYAGSTVNARAGVDSGFDQARNRLERDFAVGQTGTERARRDIGRESQSETGRIREGALQRAAESAVRPRAAGGGRRRSVRERRNIRRPRQAQILNARARRANRRVSRRNRR